MQTIRLERGEWSFDEIDRLGPAGGFGEVFRGSGNGNAVAIKRLKLSAGAASHREMKIGAALAERAHDHVVPILDYGQDADGDRYYLVMPICDYSLQEVLNRNGPFTLEEARAAALHIIAGLQEVSDIIHRDLKPGNVLWHDGRWKVADFGIAKFVEDATSLQTLRTSLTPAYAAPEQWRGERPTSAADVYALGCVIHAMLTGAPPFVGGADDVREAHLTKTPPALTGIDSRLAGLVGTMLRKAPAARPSLTRCATILDEVRTPLPSPARAALAAAGHAVSEQEAAAEAARSERQAAEREHRALINEAQGELKGIIERLFATIEGDAHIARRINNSIILGPAELIFEVPNDSRHGQLRGDSHADSFESGWEIATNAYLSLNAKRGARTAYDPGWFKFSVSLVFAKLKTDPDFRWRELSFHEIFTQRSNFDQPFSLDPVGRDFQVAVSNVMGRYQIAHGPLTIDGEDENDFQERWLNLFAKAAAGNLHPPNHLPLQKTFFSP